jgi:hypothetical protein
MQHDMRLPLTLRVMRAQDIMTKSFDEDEQEADGKVSPTAITYFGPCFCCARSLDADRKRRPPSTRPTKVVNPTADAADASGIDDTE